MKILVFSFQSPVQFCRNRASSRSKNQLRMFERGTNSPKSYLHVLWTSLNYTSWSKSSNDHLAFSSIIICLAVEVNLIISILEWMLSSKPWLLNMKKRENKIFSWEMLCKPKKTKRKHVKSKMLFNEKRFNIMILQRNRGTQIGE